MSWNSLCKWHESPLNLIFHIVALIVLIYGIWILNLKYILGAVIIALIGHFIQILLEKKTPVENKRRKR